MAGCHYCKNIFSYYWQLSEAKRYSRQACPGFLGGGGVIWSDSGVGELVCEWRKTLLFFWERLVSGCETPPPLPLKRPPGNPDAHNVQS